MAYFNSDGNSFIRSTATAFKLLFAIILFVLSLSTLVNVRSILTVSQDEKVTTIAAPVVAMKDFGYTMVRLRQIDSFYNTDAEKFITDNHLEGQVVNVTSKMETSVGIMAVVQLMMLDKDLNSPDPDACLEWIKFSSEDDSFSTDYTCGTGMAAIKATHVPGMSFLTYSDSLFVDYVSPVGHKPTSDVLTTKAQITFTNVYECPDPEREEKQTLRACKVGNNLSCIPAEMFCDGVIDCSDFGEGIGFDESNCPHLETIYNTRKNANQLIFQGQVTTVSPSFTNMFGLFGLSDRFLDQNLTIFIVLPAFLIMSICLYIILEIVISGQGTYDLIVVRRTFKNMRNIRSPHRFSWVPAPEEEDDRGSEVECQYLPWAFPPDPCMCHESGQTLPIYARDAEIINVEDEKSEKDEA